PRQTVDQGLVARVGLDGTVSSVRKPALVNTEYPQLAWTDSGALLTYAHFGDTTGLESVSIDARGARRRGPAGLGMAFFNPAPAVGVGDDALVLAGHYTGATGVANGLALVRVAPSGEVAAPIVELPSSSQVTEYRI